MEFQDDFRMYGEILEKYYTAIRNEYTTYVTKYKNL